MKLNRRDFLRATGLAGVLAAFGVKLPGAGAARELPAVTAGIVVPSTGRIKIEYKHEGGDWTALDERDEARVLRAFRRPAPHPPGLQIHKFQHTIVVSDGLLQDCFAAPRAFRERLAEHYAKAIEAEMLTVEIVYDTGPLIPEHVRGLLAEQYP